MTCGTAPHSSAAWPSPATRCSMTLTAHTICLPCWDFDILFSIPTGRADLFRAKSFLQHVPLCVARRCRHLGKQGRHSRDRHGAAEHSFRPNQTNLSDVPPLLHSQFCLHLWHHRFGGPPNGLRWHLWLRWFKRWIGWANCLWLCRPRCHCCVF